MSDINTIDQNWNDLVEKLNSIGPPNNSSNEWKRVWTEHKYNKKRKRVDDEAETQQPGPHLKKSSNPTQQGSAQPPHNVETISTFDNVIIQPNPSIRSDPLDEIIDQNLLTMDDRSFSDLLLSTNSLMFTTDNQQVSDTSRLMSNVYVGPALSTTSQSSWSADCPTNTTTQCHNIHVVDQQTKLHSSHLQDEILSKISDISTKLDTVIGVLLDTNNILNELIKRK